MSTLTEKAQQHIEKTMRDLSGDDDFMPFMTLRNNRDEVCYVGLAMPETGMVKDLLADVMVATCMLYRPVEATFASCAWMVSAEGSGDEAQAEATRLPPSQHPDRVETVFLVAVDAFGEAITHSANVIRENNMIGVGVWEAHTYPIGAVTGRFGTAMRAGIDLGQKIPQEMCEFIDQEAAADRMDDLIQRTVRLLAEARQEAVRNWASKN